MLFNDRQTYVIAEVGPNHNGSVETALEIVRLAKEAGVDAVKFQTFESGATVVSADTPLAPYMQESGSAGNQNDLHDAVGLRFDDFRTIAAECHSIGITFLSTPFDVPSTEFLAKLGVPLLKVASGEITNSFLLRAVARCGLPLIMSTGMAELHEIRAALEFVHQEWEASNLGDDRKPELALLHCTSAYPAPYSEVNLRAMDALAAEFGTPVGYSDHTLGTTVAVAAVARGARIIEKHITPDPTLAGPDHRASLPIDRLAEFVEAIRTVERALGDPRKAVTQSEKDVQRVARRSLAALQSIEAGEAFQECMLTALRPATGIPPMEVSRLVGVRAQRSYEPGELIEPDELD